MDVQARDFSCASRPSEEDMDVRKGPWTIEEDSVLKNYIDIHGEGHWNSVARRAGLKRTGKSCRLRWLNYLRPDVRRGNITLQEQLMILELHSRLGNRWSKIAQHLPGRTDNEIKNYWRTRVQKQAKQLKCDVNSKQFRDAMRNVWIPRLMERIRASSEYPTGQPTTTATTYTDLTSNQTHTATSQVHHIQINEYGSDPNFMPEISGTSSDSLDTQLSDLTECQNQPGGNYPENLQNGSGFEAETSGGAWDWFKQEGEFEGILEQESGGWLGGGESLDNLWNDENISLFLQQQLDEL